MGSRPFAALFRANCSLPGMMGVVSADGRLMDTEPPSPKTKSKLLRRAVLIATVSSVFFLLYIFIPDHWVNTRTVHGKTVITFLREPFYSFIKYLPVAGGAICIAGAFWISFKKFTAASGLLLAFAVIAGMIASVGRVSNFPAPWRKYSSLPTADGQIYYYLFESYKGTQTAALGRFLGHTPFREAIVVEGETKADSLVDNPDAYAMITCPAPGTIGTQNKFGQLMVDENGMILGYSTRDKASFGFIPSEGRFLSVEELKSQVKNTEGNLSQP